MANLFKQALAGIGVAKDSQRKQKAADELDAEKLNNANQVMKIQKRPVRNSRDEKTAQKSMLKSAVTAAIKEMKSSEISTRLPETETIDRVKMNSHAKREPNSPPEDPVPSTTAETSGIERIQKRKRIKAEMEEPKEKMAPIKNQMQNNAKQDTPTMITGGIVSTPQTNHQQTVIKKFGSKSQSDNGAKQTKRINPPIRTLSPNNDIQSAQSESSVVSSEHQVPTKLPKITVENYGRLPKERIITLENRQTKNKPESKLPLSPPARTTPVKEQHPKVTIRNKRKMNIRVRKRNIMEDMDDEEEKSKDSIPTTPADSSPIKPQFRRTLQARIRPPTPQKAVKEDSSESDELDELPMHETPLKTPRQQRALDGSMFIAPFFTKAYAFSNHFKCYFYVDKKRFCCTEQFYMYYKARVFGDTQSAREIMECTEARDMKRVGSKIRNFNTAKWRRISILVMTIGSMAKYSQNQQLRKLLFETGDSVLVEASPDDIYWGIGIRVDSASVRDVKNWPGKNVLGRILTRCREVLKSKQVFRADWESIRRQTI